SVEALRKPTSSVAHNVRWSALRWPIGWLMRGRYIACGGAWRLVQNPLAKPRESGQKQVSVSDFSEFLLRCRGEVDPQLGAWLDEGAARFRTAGREVTAVLAAVRDLTLRGGKRLRAALVAAAYQACGGEGGPARVVLAGVAVELLQTYLLIHDDWL